MKTLRLAFLGAAALLIAGPALAQWPPPPPPFVANPQVAPPARAGTPAEMRAQRRAERQQAKAARQARAKACHDEADAQKLSGKPRRQFVARCRG